jgi:predicted Zn-dependent protease
MSVSDEMGRRIERGLVSLESEALSLQPNDTDSVINLGDLLTRVGRAAEAIPLLRAALVSESDEKELHRNLVNALYEAGDPEGAVQAAREAVRRLPDMRFQHRAVFYRFLGGGKLVTV